MEEKKDQLSSEEPPGFFKQIYERLTRSLSVSCGCCARNTSKTHYVLEKKEQTTESLNDSSGGLQPKERLEHGLSERNLSQTESIDCEETIARRCQGTKSIQPWTQKEDELLLSLFEKYNGKHWREIAKFFPGKSAPICRKRVKTLKNQNKRKSWEPEEDRVLLELVGQYGKDWALISSQMIGRSGKQVRERFLNTLSPGINREKWTKEEDALILSAFYKIGSKWSEISKMLNNRPENMVKNRFHSHIKRKIARIDETDDPKASSCSEVDFFSSCSSNWNVDSAHQRQQLPWPMKENASAQDEFMTPKIPDPPRSFFGTSRETDFYEENWKEGSFEEQYNGLITRRDAEELMDIEGECVFESPSNIILRKGPMGYLNQPFACELIRMEPEKLMQIEEKQEYGVSERLIAIDFAIQETDEKIKEAQNQLNFQIFKGNQSLFAELQDEIEALTRQKHQLQDKRRQIYPQW